ncbi:hypothetical protein BLA17378_04526 [Burkholderia aenigmatica]|uniref:Uncharacterized protein n=1 Tax=Burkholderia aenigmatica TaxID=2015348 RepID=A0ABY6XYV7_9BURK|nr:hypothetical protein [Burkholderia aenigmatica]VWC90391.1 hypothetical protein BLA17378_04526 [Burkholderia aenigmatica]
MSKGSYQIPFDTNGNQLGYPVTWRGIEWRDNEPFEDTLIYKGYGRGRSSAVLIFKRASTGTEVQFFMSDFDDIVNCLLRGAVSGRFDFVKKGQNYGCKMIAEIV